jgi:hypothetical protein
LNVGRLVASAVGRWWEADLQLIGWQPMPHFENLLAWHLGRCYLALCEFW